MELRQLEYFMEVCEQMHFTRAADKLGIAQPSLSQQIRLLEHEVGMPLFDRIGRRIALTEAGRILRAHGYKVFHELSQAQAAIRDLQGLQRGSLRIGALLSVTRYLLPQVLESFHRAYPNIDVTVLGLRSGDIREGLLKNELDLGLGFHPAGHAELEGLPLGREELVLAVPCGHRLAREPEVSLDVLRTEPSVLMPGTYELRQLLDRRCEEEGFRPKPLLEMTTLDAIVQLVERGLGVTVLPRPYVEQLRDPALTAVPFRQPGLYRELGIAYRTDKFMCAATRMFIHSLQEAAPGPGAVPAPGSPAPISLS